jgi:hypothetical protein
MHIKCLHTVTNQTLLEIHIVKAPFQCINTFFLYETRVLLLSWIQETLPPYHYI